jgi:predicted secreted hydrolase
LTDVSGEQFQSFERYSRSALGLAGAIATPYQVWLDEWRVQATGEGTYQLSASADQFRLDLSMIDSKGPVLQGDRGYSQKGPGVGNASYYISQTRLITDGSITLGDQLFSIHGFSWMDHEFSTSALTEGQVGWDWFALQLDDGSELMVFQIRREDGSIDPFSSGTYIDPNGKTTHLERADFNIKALDTWQSPRSGAVYPSGWSVDVPALDLSLEVQPYLKAQELDLTFKYWEGAVKIAGSHQGEQVGGSGYVELTGYTGSMAGQF